MSRKIFESRFYFIIIVLIFCFFTLTYEIINRNKRKSLDVNFDYNNNNKNYLKIINNKKKLINKLNYDVKKKYNNEITIRNLKEDIKEIKRKYNDEIKNKKKNKKRGKKPRKKINIFVRENEYDKYNELRKRDIRSVHDPLSPPDRRLPRHIYPSKKIKKNFNYPTRGYPDDYHMLGILSRESDEKMLKLFGRQTYPGSSQWEYYLLKNGLESIKIPIKKGNNLEIDNNELLDVPQLNMSRGKFKVTLYKLDAPRYNPHIY
jgi:hypothetical protein